LGLFAHVLFQHRAVLDRVDFFNCCEARHLQLLRKSEKRAKHDFDFTGANQGGMCFLHFLNVVVVNIEATTL